jgi:FkbM family methyltransferase
MEKFYKINDGKIYIPDNIKKVKLDIGLSINAPHSAIWLNNEPNDLLVFGFEPNPDSIEQIKGNKPYVKLWENRIQDFSLVGNKLLIAECALGLETKKTTLYVTGVDAGCSSTYEPHPQFQLMRPLEKKITVEQYRLEEFFKIFPFEQIPYIEYIKIDAQGADLDIIKSGGEYIKDYVVYVTLEPENNQYLGTNNSVNSINDYMKSIGFQRINHSKTNDPTFINEKFINLKDNISIFQC